MKSIKRKKQTKHKKIHYKSYIDIMNKFQKITESKKKKKRLTIYNKKYTHQKKRKKKRQEKKIRKNNTKLR